jgi:hypothetical protein
MKNTTNWNLCTSSNSEKEPTDINNSEVENKDFLKKLKLIEKAFK